MLIKQSHALFWVVLIIGLTALLSWFIFQQAWIADWLKVWLTALIVAFVF